jgi:16S rRNA (guanine966-N2)-methyltransferase
VRIIAGEFRGRSITPAADRRVRPTADRVREAWFSILGTRLAGARVLDLFAGSGALGLEALSRGAEFVDFVELARPSLEALRANIDALDVGERVRVHRGDALRFVESLDATTYDVAFADPPYTTQQAQELVAAFRRRPFAGILGIEHASGTPLDGDETRKYGNVSLTFCEART